MEQVNIPHGYQRVMPYLIVENGTAFQHFMLNVFGAEERHRTMRDEKLIMHAELRIGDSVIMFADSTEKFSTKTAGMFIYVADTDDTYKKALAAGATSIMEPADQEYGRSAGITDPFGNDWWITSAAPK